MADLHQSALAWELLGEQTTHVAGLTSAELHDVVISAITQADGQQIVLSRYGDTLWDLAAHIHSPGLREVEKTIDWGDDLPAAMVNDIKAAIYVWKQTGRPGHRPPTWHTVRVSAVMALAFARWLQPLRIERFDQVTRLHVANYLHHCRHELKLGSRGARSRLECIEVLWVFRKQLQHPMKSEPWPNTSLWKLTGLDSGFETASTPIIPRQVQERLYNHSVGIIDASAEMLDQVDAGELRHWEAEVMRVRDAALYLVSITTGMRNDEVLRIEKGAYREEVVDGVTRRWVKTVESKTGKGLRQR